MVLIRQHSKTTFGGSKPSAIWPWKQNGAAVVTALMILEVVDNWGSVLQINIKEKKLDFEP